MWLVGSCQADGGQLEHDLHYIHYIHYIFLASHNIQSLVICRKFVDWSVTRLTLETPQMMAPFCEVVDSDDSFQGNKGFVLRDNFFCK